MALITVKDFEGAHGFAVVHPEFDRCFFCEDKLTVPFIVWFGVPHPIGLHPECANTFCLQLRRDVTEHRHGKEFASQWYEQAKQDRGSE
jgi:hypothetical protein